MKELHEKLLPVLSNWGNKIDTKVRAYWEEMGPESCQKKILTCQHRNANIDSREDFSQKCISNANSVTESVCPENGSVNHHQQVVCFVLHAKYSVKTRKSSINVCFTHFGFIIITISCCVWLLGAYRTSQPQGPNVRLRWPWLQLALINLISH